MSKRTLTVAVALALVAAGGWALAQQTGVVPPPAAGPQAPPVPKAPRGATGRYAVALAGERGLLVDTAAGKTWELVRGSDGRAAWIPARKLGSDKEARQWLGAEKERAADQERAKAAALRAEAKREAARPRDLSQEHDLALRALEAAQRRLRELERKATPDKDKK
jgi:hypothetical protein